MNKFEPRLSISGPLKRDRLLFGQYLQYRFVRTPVKSLPGEPQLGLDSFDSFTRLDGVLSSRHALTGGVIYFPRKITNATLSTFRPEETTPKFWQAGFSAGMVDRLILSANAVLESTVAARTFQVDEKTKGELPMIYAPQGQGGNFFNRQERHVRSLQFVEALTFSKNDWAGEHVFKTGLDVQYSRFDGDNYSQQVTSSALDGTLAERTTYSPPLDQSRGDRHGSRALRAGSLARERSPELRARLPRRLRRRGRESQLFAAHRHVGERAAGRAGHPPRRVRQVRGADAAECRRASPSTTCRR